MDCKKISVLKILHDTVVDGAGLRTSVYCAGCGHRCSGCHNPESWHMSGGTLTSVRDIYEELISNPMTNVTFTGGEPMGQAVAFCELAKLIRENTDKTIWCYTGFSFEDILRANDCMAELLRQVDVLVDGRYIEALKDRTLPFRGSSNQRIIDVQRSLREKRIVIREDI